MSWSALCDKCKTEGESGSRVIVSNLVPNEEHKSPCFSADALVGKAEVDARILPGYCCLDSNSKHLPANEHTLLKTGIQGRQHTYHPLAYLLQLATNQPWKKNYVR